MATQIHSGSIKIGDDNLYYEGIGEGKTLVLIHAGFVDSGMWDDQWDALAQHYNLIRYDMRGYGKSDALKAPADRRDDLRQLLDHLNIQRAALLGCSVGGEIALDFALEHPERVSALITVSAVPSGFEMKGEPPRYMMDMMEAMQQDDVERVSDLQLRILFDGEYREPIESSQKARQHAAAMNKVAVGNRTWLMDAEPVNPLDPPAVKRLKDIQVPTLAIVGALDNAEISRAADLMVKEIKGAKKVVIEDAAHVPNMDQPEEFNRIVVEFLGD
jgi:pimeloyl-ACP methyl ester carboxylesterase